MREHNLMGVPAFIIGDESFAGLDVDRLERLIDYRVEKCSNCGQLLRVPKDKGTILVTCSKCDNKFKVDT
jgi:ABC-type molybdenum transport system ATPase subunit/photorepair protein PhrA